MTGAVTHDHVAELERLGLDYWWYAVRRGHVDAALARCAARGPLRVLDVGCGPGIVAEHVKRRFAPERLLGLDGTREALDAAAARGVPAAFADLARPFDLDFAPNAVTALDVLEHLDDPVGTLRNLAAAVVPGATLIVTVPALPALTSRWDELSGHRRRYTRKLLIAHLRAGGFAPARVRHFFSYCVPPAWIERRLLRRVRAFEFPDVPPALNALLVAAGRVERALGCPLPFGTSLLAVARRAGPGVGPRAS